MVNVDVDAVEVIPPTTRPPGGAVLALVGITGAWSGSGAVSCSGELACLISSRMLMTDFAGVDADVLDAIGEIANMVIGNVKEDLAPELGPLAISTPTVIHGHALQTRGVEGDTSARLTFACEGDILEVCLNLVPSSRS